MLCADTYPVPEARTDLGAMSPVIVEINFILESDESVSAITCGVTSERATKITINRIRMYLIYR